VNGIRGSVALTGAVMFLAACGGLGTTEVNNGGDSSGSSPSSATPKPASSDRSDVRYAVTGVVRDTAGRAVEGVNIAMVSLDVPGNPVPELAVLTDRRGRYAWPASVRPGRYELRVNAPGGTATTHVTVRAGVVAKADLTLRPQ